MQGDWAGFSGMGVNDAEFSMSSSFLSKMGYPADLFSMSSKTDVENCLFIPGQNTASTFN